MDFVDVDKDLVQLFVFAKRHAMLKIIGKRLFLRMGMPGFDGYT